ncbi:hypothetical protein BOTBODRAFT_35979 [Botryobasidium botryosum FD-172 SS1]|uniref:Uncharacterized protein n=1 Tax=Botryobasidium botryosum (strain FD-172 SS1) TaxID=930990 RepID=A0A067M7H5_BOTB1|nr:hypothetical protein BOTBODRAFT_35979 [Botryobasidium botryosum FD-172 SS1]
MAQTIQVPAGYRGTATGIIRSAGHLQRAKFELKDSTGYILASSTLVGTGGDVVMKEQVNPNSMGWSLGPFPQSATMSILIENQASAGQPFKASKVIEPINVYKPADSLNRTQYLLTTVLSKDHNDNDWNDATINVFRLN